MVGRHCCVPGCASSSLRNKDLTFSGFPRDPEQRNEWIRIISSNSDLSSTVSQRRPWSTPIAKLPLGQKYQVVCGYHFRKDGRKKKNDKYPTFFANQPEGHICPSVSHEIEIRQKTYSELDPDVDVMELDLDVGVMETIYSDETNDSANNVTDHNYYISHDHSSLDQVIKSQKNELLNLHSTLEELNLLKTECDQLKTENLALKTAASKVKVNVEAFQKLKIENVALKKKVSDLKLECLQKKCKINILEKQVKENGRFSLRKVSKSPSMLKFYTGCENIEGFNELFEFVEPDLKNLQLYNGSRGYKRKFERKQHTKGRPMVLSFNEQLFMVLCRLKVGLLEEDIAYRFNISLATVSNLCITWFNLLENRLTKLQIWPSRAVVDKYMPEEFKLKFPTTRVLIDASEFFIQKPNDFKTQSDTWSTYKTHNTAKGLIGVTPNGFISFVSDLVPGRMSDKELTEQSGFINLLSPGDSVMADRGFLIEDLLKEKGVSLNMPPFLHNKAQLSLQEEKDTRDIASLRIHVERVIRSVKTYHILSTIIPNNMSIQLNKIWKICTYLVNFCSEPLLDIMK